MESFFKSSGFSTAPNRRVNQITLLFDPAKSESTKPNFQSCLMIDLGRETDDNNEICLGVCFALCVIKALRLARVEHCSSTVVTCFLPSTNAKQNHHKPWHLVILLVFRDDPFPQVTVTVLSSSPISPSIHFASNHKTRFNKISKDTWHMRYAVRRSPP